MDLDIAILGRTGDDHRDGFGCQALGFQGWKLITTLRQPAGGFSSASVLVRHCSVV
jgi:hypothetical protein